MILKGIKTLKIQGGGFEINERDYMESTCLHKKLTKILRLQAWMGNACNRTRTRPDTSS